MKTLFSLILLVLCSLSVFGQNDFNLPASARLKVRELIKANSFYRLAVPSDCDDELLTDVRNDAFGAAYQPYFVKGDFNIDTLEDIAFALIDTRKSKDNFDVFIFHRKADGSFAAKPFIQKGFDLSRGGLYAEGYGKGRLQIINFDSFHGIELIFGSNRYRQKPI